MPYHEFKRRTNSEKAHPAVWYFVEKTLRPPLQTGQLVKVSPVQFTIQSTRSCLKMQDGNANSATVIL